MKQTKNKKKNPPSVTKRTNRRETILKIITEIGLWNINKTELAKKFSCNTQTITADIKHILANIDIIDTETIKFELARSYKQLTNVARKEFSKEKQPASSRQGWGHLMLKSNVEHTKFLEAYGIKEVVMLKGDNRDELVSPEEFRGWYEDQQRIESEEKEDKDE